MRDLNRTKMIAELFQAKYFLIRQTIQDLQYLEISVSGDSMEPTFYDGETVLVTSLPAELRLGDILLFYDFKDLLVLHRIVDFQEDCVVLVGDNATTKDIINVDQILGKAVCKASEMPMINRRTKDYSCIVHGIELKETIVDGKSLGFQLYALPEQKQPQS